MAKSNPNPTKPPARKRSSKAAPVFRTPHEARPPERMPPTISADVRRTLENLPAGFKAEGFEIIGDQVRVHGKVIAVVGSHGDVHMADSMQGQVNPAPAPAGRIPVPVDTRSPLVAAIDSVGNNISELACVLDCLEEKLSTVLEVQPPAAAGETAIRAEPATPFSPAVDQLHNQCGRLRNLIDRVGVITRRVEA